MTLDLLSTVLLLCIAINYAVLLAWFTAWAFAGDAIHRLHSRWFRVERATYDAATFLLLGSYKLGIWLFFVVPWIALQVASSTGGATP